MWTCLSRAHLLEELYSALSRHCQKKEWRPGGSRFPEKNERKTEVVYITEVLMFAWSTTTTLVNVQMSSVSFTFAQAALVEILEIFKN
jgi:hypothetical protein